MTNLKKEIIETADTYLDLAKEKFTNNIKLQNTKIKYGFSLKGKVAGVAYTRRPEVRYNLVIASKSENKNQFLNQTVPHEVAHVVVSTVFPFAKAHGNEWKNVMKNVFGCEPARCHNMKTESARKTRKFSYACKCGIPHIVGVVRHNRQRAGTSNYICSKCHSNLTFIKEI